VPLFDMVGLILAHPGRCGRGPNMSAGGQSLRASRCPRFIFSSSAGGCCGVWLCLFGLLDRAFVDTGFRTGERCCFASVGALCWLDYKQRSDSYFSAARSRALRSFGVGSASILAFLGVVLACSAGRSLCLPRID